MALRQRLEKKGMGAQVKARLGHKQQVGIMGNSAQTVPINKPPHGYSMVIPNNAMPSSKYAYVAGNLHVPTHAIPINKQPIMNVPLQSVIKSKQPFTHQHTALSVASRINQPPLDVTMPSSQSFWRLWPHPSLDFDVHRQKIVSKKNQVVASWRQLSPHLQGKKNECYAVADVIEVSSELFQLKDLKDILSLEAWKSCLSPSERKFLRGLLPEGVDNKSLVCAITGGDNFCFGNPLVDWGSQLLKGELHPDFVQQKELQLEQAQNDHYQEVHSYREKMLETLRVLKEEWILCKSAEQRLVSKPKRRKSRVHDCTTANEGNAFRQKRKRRKVESLPQALGKMDADSQSIKNRLSKGFHNDDCTQTMHILKVTRKQYADVLHLMKGKGDELALAALGAVLNHQQKIEIDLANGCNGEETLKTHNFWFKQVVGDIPAAHAVFSQRKTDKERLAKSAAEQCLQYYSVFMDKEDEIDQQSNSDAILLMEAENLMQEDEIDQQSNSDAIVPIEAENLVVESRKSSEANMRNSLASESSVTCLEEQAGTQAAVESCLSSVDCSRDMLSQRLIQEEQVSLIDLPSGSSLVGEGHATLLPMVQAERKGHSLETGFTINLEERSGMNIQTVRTLETDTLSECNEGSVLKPYWVDKSLDVQETRSSCIDHVHCDLHSKPGSEVVSASAAAASGESEEVDQRVIHQLGGANACNALNDQLFCLSGPSMLLGHEETTGRNSLYTSSLKGCKDTLEPVAHQVEMYQKVIKGGTFQESAPSPGKLDESEDVHAKDYGHVFEMDHNQADNDQSNQMMLHLFPDEKSHSSGFLSSEVSSSHGKKSLCGRDEAMPLASGCDGEPTLKEHEPITELSLLVDDRSTKQNFMREQADSVSSRTGADFGLHDALEPHWMLRNKPEMPQVYPFHQSSREIHHLAQSSQDAYSPHSFTPVPPGWPNPQQQMSHHGFVNHWNMEEGADQTNWVLTEAAITPPFFSSAKDDVGRPSVSNYWDQLSRGPCMNGWSMKHDQSANFLRRPTPPDLHDEQFFQAQDNWGSVHAQPPAHLPYMWAMDRSGRSASHPWKNTSFFSHAPPQCEQQKVQNACLSKMNPNFSASWH